MNVLNTEDEMHKLGTEQSDLLLCNDYCGVIFDMDGVIFDSESIWKQASERANILFKTDLTETDRQNCCGKDELTIRQELRARYPDLDVNSYREFINTFVREKECTEGVPQKCGFLRLIEFLKQNKFKTALATASRKERALRLFEKQGQSVCELFDAAVYADDVKTAKPDPDIFLTAAKKIGVAPKNCIVIEDSINGIIAAKRGCFAPIMIVDLIKPTEECKRACVHIADELNSVLEFLNITR